MFIPSDLNYAKNLKIMDGYDTLLINFWCFLAFEWPDTLMTLTSAHVESETGTTSITYLVGIICQEEQITLFEINVASISQTYGSINANFGARATLHERYKYIINHYDA